MARRSHADQRFGAFSSVRLRDGASPGYEKLPALLNRSFLKDEGYYYVFFSWAVFLFILPEQRQESLHRPSRQPCLSLLFILMDGSTYSMTAVLKVTCCNANNIIILVNYCKVVIFYGGYSFPWLSTVPKPDGFVGILHLQFLFCLPPNISV